MGSIFRRELETAFKTPFAYFYIAGYLLITGILFSFGNLASVSGSISSLVSNQVILLVFLMPLITMRLFSDDRRNKTDQLLLTAPVSVWSMVLGKVLAAYAIFAAMLLCTAPYIIIIAVYSAPAWSEIFCGYLGLFLLGAVFLSVGALMSAMTENPLIALVTGIVCNLFLFMVDGLTQFVPEFLKSVTDALSIFTRFEMFGTSILSPSALLYMVTFAGFFVFLTQRVIEKRRWSEG